MVDTTSKRMIVHPYFNVNTIFLNKGSAVKIMLI